ncbi:two-component system response regulator [Vibrio albus]|uniref:Two-component system response regulator n=1 Tax=Vibrio albus TaxID=2200953 RepID=A0A2U3B9V6_9VIBR|nr:two-component system response regulator [Vibrio albus]
MSHINYSVLLVDDDQDVLDAYQHLMNLSRLHARSISDPTQALSYITSDWAGVVVLDMYMPQMHGMELLKAIKAVDEHIPIIVVTGHGDIPMAVEAVKQGASEFIEKPIDPAKLLPMLNKHIRIRKTFVEQKQSVASEISHVLIGKSAQLKRIREHIAQYALLNTHVVIHGESGTGRHIVAELLHSASAPETEDRPLQYLTGNSTVSVDMLEDQLRQTQGGTLIIDDLHHLTEPVQRYLTQSLLEQERDTHHRPRIISIFTDLPEMLLNSQNIIPELYYLLNQGVVEMPPLRARPDDIAAIFHHFLKQSCIKLGKPLPSVESNYLSLLRAHQWPGNVRELRNVAELFAIGIIKLTGKESVYRKDEISSPLDELVEDYEKRVIEDALFLHSGHVSDAATYLQVPRKKLYLRMKKYNIDKDHYKSEQKHRI